MKNRRSFLKSLATAFGLGALTGTVIKSEAARLSITTADITTSGNATISLPKGAAFIVTDEDNNELFSVRNESTSG